MQSSAAFSSVPRIAIGECNRSWAGRFGSVAYVIDVRLLIAALAAEKQRLDTEASRVTKRDVAACVTAHRRVSVITVQHTVINRASGPSLPIGTPPV